MKTPKRTAKKKQQPAPEILKGWQQISAFLGEPASVVQRWATEGMPVRLSGVWRETCLLALQNPKSGVPDLVATSPTDIPSVGTVENLWEK
jgi:hypothetical protein